MKLPHELQPGDRFYFQYSIGEELKLWKVWAIGPHSVIASSENLYVKVPIFYKHLEQPESHFCYVPPRPGFFEQFWSALSLKPAPSPEKTTYPERSWGQLAPQPVNGMAL